MRSTSFGKQLSILSLALGSLMMTGFSVGKADAFFSCTLDCTRDKAKKKGEGSEAWKALLNKCAEKCDIEPIMDMFMTEHYGGKYYYNLDEANKKKVDDVREKIKERGSKQSTLQQKLGALKSDTMNLGRATKEQLGKIRGSKSREESKEEEENLPKMEIKAPESKEEIMTEPETTSQEETRPSRRRSWVRGEHKKQTTTIPPSAEHQEQAKAEQEPVVSQQPQSLGKPAWMKDRPTKTPQSDKEFMFDFQGLDDDFNNISEQLEEVEATTPRTQKEKLQKQAEAEQEPIVSQQPTRGTVSPGERQRAVQSRTYMKRMKEEQAKKLEAGQ